MKRAATLLSLSGCFIYRGGGTKTDTGTDTEPCAQPLITVYQDTDRDSWGDPKAPFDSCGPVQGYVQDATDCDDTDPRVHPTEPELCDGRDNDCDATTIEAGVAFVGVEGGTNDLTEEITAAGSAVPIALLLPDDGTLYLCPGDWHVSLTIDANVEVIGVGGPTATTLRGDDLLPGVVVDGPREVTVRGLSIAAAAPVEANGVLTGGALACSGAATLAASDLIVYGDEPSDDAQLGGMISARNGCALSLSDSALFGGWGLYGGQIYVENATAVVSATDLSGGAALAGGAVMVGNFLEYKGYTGGGIVASFDCVDCTFSNHTTGVYYDVDDNHGLGGAIAAFGNAAVTITGGQFIDNVAGTGGGAVALFPGASVVTPDLPQVVFDGVTFDGNLGGLDREDVYIATDPPAVFTFDPGPQSATCGPETCN